MSSLISACFYNHEDIHSFSISALLPKRLTFISLSHTISVRFLFFGLILDPRSEHKQNSGVISNLGALIRIKALQQQLRRMRVNV